MSGKVGGISGGVVPNTTSFDPKGSIFAHHRLGPSGPVLPGGAGALSVNFNSAVGEDTFSLIQIDFPVTEADQLTCRLPRNTDDPFGDTLALSFFDIKVGSLFLVNYSFGFKVTSTNGTPQTVETVLGISATGQGIHIAAPPAISTGGLIQNANVIESDGETSTTVMGSMQLLFPASVPGDYSFVPFAYTPTGSDGAVMVPTLNQVALSGILFGPP